MQSLFNLLRFPLSFSLCFSIAGFIFWFSVHSAQINADADTSVIFCIAFCHNKNHLQSKTCQAYPESGIISLFGRNYPLWVSCSILSPIGCNRWGIFYFNRVEQPKVCWTNRNLYFFVLCRDLLFELVKNPYKLLFILARPLKIFLNRLLI